MDSLGRYGLARGTRRAAAAGAGCSVGAAVVWELSVLYGVVVLEVRRVSGQGWAGVSFVAPEDTAGGVTAVGGHNLERENATRRARYAEDAEYREQRLRENRESYGRAASRAPRASTMSKASRAEYMAEYWAREPDKRRLHRSTRRARTRSAFVEPVSSLVVLERDDGVCGICGGDVDPYGFDVDHIIPLARGGEHSYQNVQAAHPLCNKKKYVND